jgi:hypothetical protein
VVRAGVEVPDDLLDRLLDDPPGTPPSIYWGWPTLPSMEEPDRKMITITKDRAVPSSG